MSTQSKNGNAISQGNESAQAAKNISLPKGNNETSITSQPKSDDGKTAEAKQGQDHKDNPEYSKGTPDKSSTSTSIQDLIKADLQDINKLLSEIAEVKSQKLELKKAIGDIKQLIAPVKRADKRLNKTPARVTPEQRKVLKVKQRELKKTLRTVNDIEAELNEKLKRISENESRRLDIQNLYDQSHSIVYTKKNEYIIREKILDVFNGILHGENLIHKASFEAVRRLSFGTGEASEEVFNSTLAELLKNIDKRTCILASGRLKNKLFRAIRLTLQNWNPTESSISRLMFPEDLEQDKKQAGDPFIANSHLLESLILRFFNGVLSNRRDTLITLRTLAKDPAGAKEFSMRLDELLNSDDGTEIYMIGAGGLRDRLNETLRLTLLKWQPELKGGFEEVEFPNI